MRLLPLQNGEYDCGYAAIKGLFLYLGYGEGYRYLHSPNPDQPPTLEELIAYAKGHGMTLEALKAEEGEILLGDADTPFLAVIRSEGKTHMAVVLRQKGKHIELYDPAIGKIRMRNQRFYAMWEGRVLLRPTSYNAPFLPGPRPLLSKRKWITLSLLSLLPGIFLLLSFFLNLPIWGRAILLGAMGVSYLFSRLALQSLLKEMDLRAKKTLLYKKERKETYTSYSLYKGKTLAYSLQWSSLLLSLVATVTLLCSWNIPLLILAGYVLGSGVLLSLFYEKLVVRKQEKAFASEEHRYFEGGNEEDLDHLLKHGRWYGGYLDLYHALGLLNVILAVAIYAGNRELNLLEALMLVLLLAPLRDIPTSLWSMQKLNQEAEKAKTAFLMEEGGSFHN